MNESSVWIAAPAWIAALVALYLWTALSLRSVFAKAGVDPRLAWVPLVNIVALARLGGASPALSVLALVPLLGWVVLVPAYVRVSRDFGYGPGWAALALVLLPAWASVVGWGAARWLGLPATTADVAPLGEPPRVAPAVLPPIARSTYTPPSASVPESSAPLRPPSSRSILPSETPWQPPQPAELVEPLTPYAPRATRSTYEPSDGTFDTAAEVSAVAGAPTRGVPRSALTSVSAQHAGLDDPRDDSVYAEPPATDFRDPRQMSGAHHGLRGADALPVDLDETAIGSRRSAAWLLTPAAGRAVPITADVVILGRTPVRDPQFAEAQLVVISDDTRTMSKTHARLELHDDVWMIIDLDSTNGVVLLHEDGSEVEASSGVPLPAGERFLLGDAEMLLTRSLPS